MATCAAATDGIQPPEGGLVLRVKRKRDEDPAEALVVTKRTKCEAGTSVFHFVGTLGESDSDGVILDRLKHYRDRAGQVKSKALTRLSLEHTRAKRREAVKAKSSAHRFKVTSQMRCLQSSDTDNGSSSTDTASAAGGEGAVRASNNVHICDAMQDSEKDDVEDIRLAMGALTCNNTVMVREKAMPKADDYVYDLYYTQEPGTLNFNVESATFDWSSLSVCESELVHDIIDDKETQEEEDDSNDEDNWRNDYPDEEDFLHSPDSEDSECHSDKEYRGSPHFDAFGVFHRHSNPHPRLYRFSSDGEYFSDEEIF